jgi:4-amino-4-deoxy-L-arabinose transferase-like glycosyltransferase
MDSPNTALSTYHLGKMQWLILSAILAASFCLRLAFVHEPFERDEGSYAYIGQEILRGAVPYKDVIEIKPPAIYYLYAAAMTVFGETAEGIRIFTALYSLLTVYAVFLVTCQIAGQKAGLISSVLYGVFSSAPLLQGSSSNAEVFLALPWVLGIYFILRAMVNGERRYLFLCGVSCGAAMLVKTVAIPLVLLAALGAASLPRPDQTIREKALDLAMLVFGAAILALTTVAYFFLNGTLDDFLYWNVTFALRYLSTKVGGPPFLWTSIVLVPELLPLVLAAIPTFFRLLFKVRGRRECIVALTLPAALIGVILPGKNFPHYFIQLVPPLAILAGIEIARLSTMSGWPLNIKSLLLVSATFIAIYMRYEYYLLYTPNQVSIKKYGPVFVQSLEVARYLRERTLPADYIFQWGFEMELYYLTSRRSPVPFIASLFVGWSKDPANAARRMVKGINEKKPKYIVFQEEWGNVPGHAEIIGILMRDYAFEATIAYAQIYRRK